MSDGDGAAEALRFDLDDVSVELTPGGSYHGVTRLTDRRTGRQVIDERYSALNLFRLFAVNQGMGQPRLMDREVTLTDDGMVIHWPRTDVFHGDLTARYVVREPGLIDLSVTARHEGSYAGFEVFVSSYFDQALRPYVYLKPDPRANQTDYDLVLPTYNPVFQGTLLVFPRDEHAARMCLDGRWSRCEMSAPTVQPCPVRHFQVPVAWLAVPDSDLAVVLGSRPGDCCAVSTRYWPDEESHRMTTYSAFDLALFGHDATAGMERTVRVRLALCRIDGPEDPLRRYQDFLAEAGRTTEEG